MVLERLPEQAYHSATALYPRFEQAYLGLEWFLAKEPEIGIHGRIDGINVRIYVQDTDQLANTPAIWVVYEYDDDQVVILAMNVEPPPT